METDIVWPGTYRIRGERPTVVVGADRIAYQLSAAEGVLLWIDNATGWVRRTPESPIDCGNR